MAANQGVEKLSSDIAPVMQVLQETKQILDVAAAAEIYARRQQLGEDSRAHASLSLYWQRI